MVFILTASLIYRRMHTKKGAKIALVVSTLVVSVVYVFLNAYIMLPMYASVYGLPIETIVDMGMPSIHGSTTPSPDDLCRFPIQPR